MKRRMTSVEVVLDKQSGSIYIKQENYDEGTPESIQLYPEQVDLLIRWLQDAKEEASK